MLFPSGHAAAPWECSSPYERPFWASCFPLGLLLPIWKVSKKANLLLSRLLLLIFVLILKKGDGLGGYNFVTK
jgi:hypothetical protein